jgi:hypothetical protein
LNALEKVDNPSMGVLQVLGVVAEAEPTVTQDPDMTRLSYVQAEINGKMTLAMVDSGATHNFMREDIAQVSDCSLSRKTSFKAGKLR